MARTTPAQKPRGEQSTTFRTGFDGFDGIDFPETAHFPRAFLPSTWAAPGARVKRNGCMARNLPLYSGHFPIITDDLVLRPRADEA
jgi:hypothetical protein